MTLTSAPTIAVTGSTGTIGRGVADRLAAGKVRQRLIVRDPSRAPRLPHAQVAVASYADFEHAREALAGMRTLFMVSASEDPDRLAEHRSFVDAAVAAGVGRIVYLSFYGASEHATFLLARDHWQTERHIAATGLAYTFLRDNLYADFLPRMAGPDGVIRGPAGDGRVGAVAQVDVMDVASVVLTEAGEHDLATYDITGPESLSLAEAAEIIGLATGRAMTYQSESVEQAFASRAGLGAPDWQVAAWVSTYTAIAAGELDGVSDDVRRITGHEPLSLSTLFGG
ncbi:MAG: SDR family oxidoreductase [Nocardioidaceae bacterium]